MSQQSSFDFQEDHQFLHVVQDGKVLSMSLEDVFDKDTYHTLKAVTFVSSPTFFFEQARHFQSVSLILGIEDGQMVENFGLSVAKLFDVEERINLLNDLPEDVRNKIFDAQFQIRYPRNGHPVHSKIYLLEGDYTNRLMIGSANLTQRGFGNHNQYEELMIFDDSSLYDIYAKRFDFIYANTVDYIPEKIKQQREIITDPDTLLDILKEESLTLKTVVSEEQMNELKDMNHAHQQESENLKKKREIAELILQKSSQNNGYLVHKPATLEKKKNPIRNVVLKQTKHTAELDQRKEYIYDDKEENILLSTPNEETWTIFSTQQPREKVQEQFHLLLNFLKTFQTFSVNPNAEQVTQNMQRAFEVIMYSLISPYIWRIRQEQSLQEGSRTSKKDLSPFLIISGGSNSGKTTLLEFVSALLGSPNQYYSHSQFRGKKSLLGFFHSNNLHPILTDEMPHNFFTGKIGEEIVKNVANDLEGKHPVLIGTTNADGFHAQESVLNRIYFINFNHSFDTTKKREGDVEKSSIFEAIDDTLFRDVSFQISNAIQQGDVFYQKSDMLHFVREIFIHYFEAFNLPVPSYFPKNMISDYFQMASMNWKRLYEYHPNAFHHNGQDTLSVNLGAINERFISQQSKDRTFLLNMLPDGAIQNRGTIIDLNREIFLDFINTKKKNKWSFLKFWK